MSQVNLPPPQKNEGRMAFLDHFEELRIRIMRCLVIFLVGFGISYFYVTDPVLDFLRKPLFEVLPPDQHKLYFTHLFENFFTHLKVAGYSALFLFSPLFFHQLWGFFSPGMYPRERKMVIPFLFFATLFFAGGAAFAYYVLFPVGFKFFIQYGLPSDTPILTIEGYYGTCLKLLLLFGLAFEMPVILSMLGFLGVVSGATLKAHRKTAILGITVLSAVFAPPDAISMLLLMGPLILMYEATIVFVSWVQRKKSPLPQSESV